MSSSDSNQRDVLGENLESQDTEDSSVLQASGEVVSGASSGGEELEHPEELELATVASGIQLEFSEGEKLQDSEFEESEGPEFIEYDRVLSILESLLFATDRPVTIGVMTQLFKGTNVNTRQIKKALEELQIQLASPHRGVTLEEVVGGFQLRTKIDNGDFLKRLSKNRPFRLSGPALEALSIVAYKQPIIKSEVDEIRGVESGHLLRALMDRGLVQFAGKSELPGKPMFYGTTRKFLEIFGLRNLQELPSLSEIDELIPDGIGEDEEGEAISLGDLTESLGEEVKSISYSEGEEDLIKITEHIQGISTSSEFFEQEKVRQREKRDQERARDIREALEVGEDVEEKELKWLKKYDLAQEEKIRAESSPSSEEDVSRWEEEGHTVLRFDESNDAPELAPQVENSEEMALAEPSEASPSEVSDDELDEFLGRGPRDAEV